MSLAPGSLEDDCDCGVGGGGGGGLVRSVEYIRVLSPSLKVESLPELLIFSGSLAGEGMSGGGEVRGRDGGVGGEVTPLCLLAGGEREGVLCLREPMFCTPELGRGSLLWHRAESEKHTKCEVMQHDY